MANEIYTLYNHASRNSKIRTRRMKNISQINNSKDFNWKIVSNLLFSINGYISLLIYVIFKKIKL